MPKRAYIPRRLFVTGPARRLRRRVILKAGRRVLMTRAAGMVGIGAAGALAAYGAYRGVQRRKRAVGRRNNRIAAAAVRKVGLSAIKKKPSKCDRVLDQGQSLNPDLTWGSLDLCALTKQTAFGTGEDRRQRMGNWAHISGFHHKAWYANESDQHVKIYQFWISPKQYTPGISDAQLQDEFYHNAGQAGDTDANWISTDSFMNFDRQINKEKYTVLKTMHFILGPRRDDAVAKVTSDNSGKKYINMFIPLGRKFTYDEEGANPTRTEQPPVFWVQFAVRMGQAAGGVAQNTFRREIRIATYFRDD